jgi:hypothetical protein
MKKMLLCGVLTLFLGLLATQALAANGCVCVGGTGIDGCGNGAPTSAKGKTAIVQDGDINKYLLDTTVFNAYWSKGEAFDKKTGWVCKRY